ncbi:MAG: capsular polysaccharide biosynthesis protein [Oscillospiraceae bacterium]|nr:capsular polysaccharide biosynthesis protein [Oscillospiraceae bacterium]
MIDFHSHVLPNIDDGSRSVTESVTLLEMLSTQGVKTVCATPHFMATEDEPEAFFEKRRRSFESLKNELAASAPDLRLGAEVLYYSGISRLSELSRFCIEGSRLLLLEMPFHAWNEYVVKEVLELSCSGEFQLVLAHIERYLPYQSEEVFEKLLEYDVVMQSNAAFFLKFRTKRKALRMLSEGKIHLLGSDCHNITSRQPELAAARAVIERKLGSDFLSFYDERAERFLEGLE